MEQERTEKIPENRSSYQAHQEKRSSVEHEKYILKKLRTEAGKDKAQKKKRKVALVVAPKLDPVLTTDWDDDELCFDDDDDEDEVYAVDEDDEEDDDENSDNSDDQSQSRNGDSDHHRSPETSSHSQENFCSSKMRTATNIDNMKICVEESFHCKQEHFCIRVVAPEKQQCFSWESTELRNQENYVYC